MVFLCILLNAWGGGYGVIVDFEDAYRCGYTYHIPVDKFTACVHGDSANRASITLDIKTTHFQYKMDFGDICSVITLYSSKLMQCIHVFPTHKLELTTTGNTFDLSVDVTHKYGFKRHVIITYDTRVISVNNVERQITDVYSEIDLKRILNEIFGVYQLTSNMLVIYLEYLLQNYDIRISSSDRREFSINDSTTSTTLVTITVQNNDDIESKNMILDVVIPGSALQCVRSTDVLNDMIKPILVQHPKKVNTGQQALLWSKIDKLCALVENKLMMSQ